MTRQERQNKLKELRNWEGAPGQTEEAKMSILISLIESLEDSLNRSSDKNNKLTNAIVWLYKIIAIATVVLALIGIFDLWLKF